MQSFASILNRSPDEATAGNEYGHSGMTGNAMYEACRDMIELTDHNGDESVKCYESHLDKLNSQYTSVQNAYWEKKEEEWENAGDGDNGDDDEGPQPDWLQKGDLGIDLPSIHREMCNRISQTIFACDD